MHDFDPAGDGRIIGRSLADPHAFGAIFERHFDAVYGYARRRVGAELAEEVATETFTRAFARRQAFDASRVEARPWLLGIAANLLRRHWRTERRRLAAYARAAERSAPAEPGLLSEVVAALDSLSRDEREALFLFAVADLSYDEIADALEIPLGTVRSRLARARRRVRGVLGDEDPAVTQPRDPKETFNV
jgi:RNA polymerase sigma-70 factor, ECF subfamily